MKCLTISVYATTIDPFEETIDKILHDHPKTNVHIDFADYVHGRYLYDLLCVWFC